jgi:dipeptidase E
MAVRRIVALGGGGFSMEPRNRRLDKWLLSLARAKRPEVLFVPTASGDSTDYIRKFYRAFRRYDCGAKHLDLFNRTVGSPRDAILTADLVYVGGGNTANLLTIWRVHGVDRAMREAWENGVVLAGVSAGAICWFESGVTDSYGANLQPLRNGLAFLKGSFCPHYDGEKRRRPAFRRLVMRGELPAGFAADDGAAILFQGRAVADIVASRKGVSAYQVTKSGGVVRENDLQARFLA